MRAQQDSGVSYLVRLTNGLMLHMDLYVVHETPQPMEQILPASSALHYQGFQWIPVQRSECQKGCEVRPECAFCACCYGLDWVVVDTRHAQGPILRAIQRFGRVSRRSGKKSGSPVIEDKAKEARHLYLAIDEAGTHVGAKRFRCCSPVNQRTL